jgi:hypothetical protein
MSISVDPLFVTRSRARGKRSITDITRKNIVRRCAVQMPQTLNHGVLFRHRPAPTRDFGGFNIDNNGTASWAGGSYDSPACSLISRIR